MWWLRLSPDVIRRGVPLNSYGRVLSTASQAGHIDLLPAFKFSKIAQGYKLSLHCWRFVLMANSNSDLQTGAQKWEGHLIKLAATAAGDFPTAKQHFVSSFPLPSHANHCEKATAKIAPSLFGFCNYSGSNHAFGMPFHFPADEQAGEAARKRFLIFDQSGACTRLILGSLHQPPIRNAKAFHAGSESVWHPDGHRKCNTTNRSEQTIVSNGSKEMPEDSDEIDALLYSDSERDIEFSNGHLQSNEEVASSGVPTKRRRLNEDTNMLGFRGIPHPCYNCAHVDEESSYVEGSGRGVSSEGGVPRFSNCKNRERRERILRTVGMLRGIIPCGKGKDAAMVLDKAIQYLRSLKLKAKVPGSVR